MNLDKILEINRRLSFATLSPWKRIDIPTDPGCKDAIDIELGDGRRLFKFPVVSEHDIDFIAHARQDVPALVAEVERLRNGLEYIRNISEQHGRLAKNVLEGRAPEFDGPKP